MVIPMLAMARRTADKLSAREEELIRALLRVFSGNKAGTSVHDEANELALKARTRQETHLSSMFGMAVICLALYVPIYLWALQSPMFRLSELWWNGTVGEAAKYVGFLLIYPVIGGFISAKAKRQTEVSRLAALRVVRSGTLTSLQAGFFEELIYRLLMPVIMAFVLLVSDWILGGFVFGHGLTYLIFAKLWVPLADFLSFGLLSSQFTAVPWLVGAAIVSSNLQFRNGHKYQGWFGMLNSWYIGIYMFFLMFHCGIVVAIVAHALYDIILFVSEYLDSRFGE